MNYTTYVVNWKWQIVGSIARVSSEARREANLIYQRVRYAIRSSTVETPAGPTIDVAGVERLGDKLERERAAIADWNRAQKRTGARIDLSVWLFLPMVVGVPGFPASSTAVAVTRNPNP